MTRRLTATLLALTACLLATFAIGTASASAATAWWNLTSSAAPTNLQPGQEGAVIAYAINAGYAPIVGSEGNKIVLKDTLPAGLEIVSADAKAGPDFPASIPVREQHDIKCPFVAQTVTCEWAHEIPQTESFRLKIVVKVSPGMTEGAAPNKVEVSGGSVEGKTLTRDLQINKEPTKFGAEDYEFLPEDAEGNPETQAGSHPFALTTNFNLNQSFHELSIFGTPEKLPDAAALPKNLHFVLPPGMIGKAAKVPRCSGANFAAYKLTYANLCDERSAIGIAIATITDPTAPIGWRQFTVPVFNLTPSPGEPARFGFAVYGVPVVLTTHVRSGSDYGVEVNIHEAPESAAVLQTQLTLWGVPNDPRHDSERGWECLQTGWWVEQGVPCKGAKQLEAENKETGPEAFLIMPPYCTSEPPPITTASGEAWNGENFGLAGETPVKFEFTPFTNCAALPFNPSIEVESDSHEASTPSGMTVTVKVPQAGTVSGEEGAVAEAAISKTVLTLPLGVQASGGSANGLLTCTSKGFGFNGGEAPGGEAPEELLLANNHFNQEPLNATECPAAAKIGTVDVKTPLLEEDLTGAVYLASENLDPLGVNTPFSSKLVLYIFAESPTSKVQVKLAGSVHIAPNGQLVSTFDHTPPVAFSELILHLFDGPRATQSTPEECGTTPPAVASFDSSAGGTATAEDSFTITSGPGKSACPAPGTQPFAPGFEAKSENPQAGAFSPFVVTIERPDGQQALKTVSVTEPPGAAAMLASVNRCPIALARALPPACPAESKVGVSTALGGLGGEHVEIPGEVFLTDSPAPGAPFGLLSVSNAEHIGVFDLGKIAVMSNITVNETTAQATVTSEPIPQFAPFVNQPGTSTGVPAQIHALRINVNRPGFTFNPTNCNELQVTGRLTGYGPGGSEGSANVASPYHAANCASLAFKPTISVAVDSKEFSRSEGLGLKVLVKAIPGQANIKKTKLLFPTSLPSRLTTIQKACDDKIFNANPANCPEGSVIGSAIAHTPVLRSPLVGPAYLVSHANASFPDAEFVLQGEGIKLVLDGKTDIKKGITSSTFETVPDAPVTTFEVNLPRGPHSAFSGFGNLCAAQNLPTEFVGQNGFTLISTTKATITKGCNGQLPEHKESELAKLLKKCKKLKNHKKRVKCEATARKQVKAVATCKKKNKGHAKKLNSCVAKARKTYALKLK